ncbi:MAG: hypothetical protein CL525_16015, partial [Aequorivita sp.]|nr:hypothetical protein [Aequorivita sp.]
LSKDWNRVRNEMFVHTRGKLPEKLLNTRRPNEDENVYKYRLEVYEPITKGSMNKAIDKLFRLFQSANYSVKVSTDLDEYLSFKRFKNEHFIGFIQKYVLRRMIEDPNALLVTIPTGEGLVNPSVKIDVDAVIVPSNNIKHISSDAVCWLQDKEKSIVTKGGKKVKEGKVYSTLTREGYFKHVQTGTAGSNKYELIEVYYHNIGNVPAVVLGGNPTVEDYFESYFSPFLPFGNECIRQYSDWTGVMTMSAFPYREEVAEDCSAKGCRNGIVFNKETEEHTTCGTCKGTGKIFSRSPYGVFIRSKSSGVFEGGQTDNSPLVKFISPPVDIIKYSGEAWENLLRKAEEALHLIFVDEAQSGKAKEIDREESDSMLTKISNNVFDEIIFKTLLYMEKYRELNNPVEPVIVKPISFRTRTEEDLIVEINQLSDKNAPVAFQVEAAKDLAKKRFSGNKAIARMVEILVAFDPIYHVNTANKAILLANGTIKKQDIVKSLFAYKTLNEIISVEGTEFLEEPLTTIFERMDQELVRFYDNAPTISIEDERKLEAQSRIRGSVGGVNGIIEINKAVAEGSMTEEAGEAILRSIYGIDLQTAAAMVEPGTPNVEGLN